MTQQVTRFAVLTGEQLDVLSEVMGYIVHCTEPTGFDQGLDGVLIREHVESIKAILVEGESSVKTYSNQPQRLILGDRNLYCRHCGLFLSDVMRTNGFLSR